MRKRVRKRMRNRMRKRKRMRRMRMRRAGRGDPLRPPTLGRRVNGFGVWVIVYFCGRVTRIISWRSNRRARRHGIDSDAVLAAAGREHQRREDQGA